MTDDDAGGGDKNGDFWMTSFVNDPLLLHFISINVNFTIFKFIT